MLPNPEVLSKDTRVGLFSGPSAASACFCMAFPTCFLGGGHHGVNVSDPGPKAVPAVSSRAKGKDRLTGRARR